MPPGQGRKGIGSHIMSLAKRIQEPPSRIHGLPCSVGTLLDTLEGAELEALKTMLGTPEQRGWSQSAIFEALKDEGYEVGRQSINRHRGGTCRCAR